MRHWFKRIMWIILGVLVLFILLLQTPLFSFRQSEAEQREALLKKGQSLPINFHKYEVPQADGGTRVMHYVHVGESHLPLVVLIHGAPGASNGMNDYLADTTLTKFAQVVAIDRPGYGFSDYGRTERHLEAQAAALEHILERYRTSKTILLGHSFGGPVIARAAMDYPNLVDGVVVVAGSVAPELEPQEWWRKPIDLPIIRSLLPGALRVCNQEILALKGELEGMLPLWKNITCPVLVFQGESDTLVPKGNADFIEQMLPHNEQVRLHMLEGGDHFILWSMRKEIVAAIRDLCVEK